MIGLLPASQAGAGVILLPVSKRLRITSSARAKRAGSVVRCIFPARNMEARCARQSFKPESPSAYRGGMISTELTKKGSGIFARRSSTVDASVLPERFKHRERNEQI